jgi:hypothetical protein
MNKPIRIASVNGKMEMSNAGVIVSLRPSMAESTEIAGDDVAKCSAAPTIPIGPESDPRPVGYALDATATTTPDAVLHRYRRAGQRRI